MPRFILLINTDEKLVADMTPEEGQAMHADYMAYTQELLAAGALRAGDPLEAPATAKVVAPGGVVSDGPFAEVSEHLGGYYIIEVAGIDEATAWAAKLPGVVRGFDRIEVRGVVDLPDMPG